MKIVCCHPDIDRLTKRHEQLLALPLTLFLICVYLFDLRTYFDTLSWLSHDPF
jgi:hypothetical protein